MCILARHRLVRKHSLRVKGSCEKLATFIKLSRLAIMPSVFGECGSARAFRIYAEHKCVIIGSMISTSATAGLAEKFLIRSSQMRIASLSLQCVEYRKCRRPNQNPSLSLAIVLSCIASTSVLPHRAMEFRYTSHKVDRRLPSSSLAMVLLNATCMKLLLAR